MAKPLEVGLEVTGEVKAAFDLRQLGVRARDLRPAARKIQRTFIAGERRWFASKGDGSWAALAEATLAKKQALGQSSAILRATDRLYRSLTSEFGQDQVLDVEVGVIYLGTKVPYARVLRAGSDVMPARDPINLRPPERTEIADIISGYIAKGTP